VVPAMARELVPFVTLDSTKFPSILQPKFWSKLKELLSHVVVVLSLVPFAKAELKGNTAIHNDNIITAIFLNLNIAFLLPSILKNKSK
jgi:hypothetical protein